MALTIKDRLRRVTLLCCHFTRNLAYYRAGRQGMRILPRQSEFWITVNGNFIDQCVLEWCKLFGDKNGQHYWGKIVADQVRFETELFQSVNQVEFQKLLQKMREYRNKFVAHLDEEKKGHIPHMYVAEASVRFYHKSRTAAGMLVELRPLRTSARPCGFRSLFLASRADAYPYAISAGAGHGRRIHPSPTLQVRDALGSYARFIATPPIVADRVMVWKIAPVYTKALVCGWFQTIARSRRAGGVG